MPTVDALAIVGPTASGKSALALTLAQLHGDAELVSIDSMQVYRGMDIGTAKPSAAERRLAPHHLIDVLDPEDECSVAWFAERAAAVRSDLDARRVPPIYVGGTGLYHRAVIDGLDIPGQWPEIVVELESEAETAMLYRRLRGLDPVAADRIDPDNRRRTIRALEVTIGSGRRFSESGAGLTHYPDTAVTMIGLDVDRDVLTDRIERRLDEQLAVGFLAEVEALLSSPRGWSRTAAQALGYREFVDVVRGLASLEERRRETLIRTRRFAVRQLKWFRRDPRVVWFDALSPSLVDDVRAHWMSAQTSGQTSGRVAGRTATK